MNRIKVTITTKTDTHALRGYINSQSDSTLCFRFWGSLGYEVGKGFINDRFQLIDKVNNTSYPDYFNQLKTNWQIYLNKNIIYNLFFGDFKNLDRELPKYFTNDFAISKKSINSYQILNSKIDLEIDLDYIYKNQKLQKILIFLNGSNYLKLYFEIIETGSEFGICNN